MHTLERNLSNKVIFYSYLLFFSEKIAEIAIALELNGYSVCMEFG